MKKYIFPIIFTCLLPTTTFSKPNLTIALQPFIPFPTVYIDTIKSGIKSKFGNVNVIVLPEIKLPQYAWYKPRNRYRAEKLLMYLDTLPGEHLKIVGLTTQDISTTKGKHYDWGIFGYGDIDAKPCVVSTFRLKKGNTPKPLFFKRLVKVVNHELGHTLGFDHCIYKNCLMEDAKGTIKTVDRSDGNFCKKCMLILNEYIFRGRTTNK